MAQYNGYVDIPHDTYQQWRNATLGNGYDADNTYQNQCWDLPAELWYQYGLRLITRPGGNGTAEDCWLISREQNAVPPFIAVYGVENIRRGDVVVFAGTTSYPTGHIAFADQDYESGMTSMNFLGQNQGQGSTNPSNIANLSLTHFIGAFRNTNWTSTPPEPEPEEKKKHKFPWVVAWHNWQNFKRF